MQLTITNQELSTIKTDCLIIAINSKGTNNAAKQINQASNNLIASTIKLGDFIGNAGQSLLIPNPQGLQAKRLLLVGTGKKELSVKQFRKALRCAFCRIKKTQAKDIVSDLHLSEITGQDSNWAAIESALLLEAALYNFNDFKSEKGKAPALKKLSLLASDKKQANAFKKLIPQALATAHAMTFTKNLGNTPSNVCNPTYLAKQAQALAKAHRSISAQVIDEKELKKMGAGCFISVSQGSSTPGKLIIMKHKGTDSKAKPIVLVGKGVTFDTGGNCLKPAAGMMEMKFDMCGSATVFGAMQACAELNLSCPVIGIVAAAENMVNGEATRMRDVVTSLSGQTVEITNTDAEGRLVLCDALTYAERFNPKQIISMATLTGAAIISLGTETTALMTNEQSLADKLLAAGEKASDATWQLPLNSDYDHYLNSDVADFLNASLSRAAGTIVAANFLSRFTKKMKWAHLDIAGTATTTGRQAAATGRPIPLLVNYLLTQGKPGK